MFKRVLLLVLDSVGAGAAPDAAQFDDVGSNTLLHIIQETNIKLPNLNAMGLGRVIFKATGSDPLSDGSKPQASWGLAVPKSPGKDTTSGHWELMGLTLAEPLPVYPNGFPDEIIQPFTKAIGRGVLGNYAASGTVIIQELGPKHMESGKPIVYTSADSVFQVAAHEEIIPVEELYRWCSIARELLVGKHAVGRVIARPFTGRFPHFQRTNRRKDFSLPPVSETVLDVLQKNDVPVHAIGKVEDIFAGKGISSASHSVNNQEGITYTLDVLKTDFSGLIFTNLVDFDMLYGHRRDVNGYASALKYLDTRLTQITKQITSEDCLIITADHGNDPTFSGTDHTREMTPLLMYSPKIKPIDLGFQNFIDVGATILDCFRIEHSLGGQSFLSTMKE